MEDFVKRIASEVKAEDEKRMDPKTFEGAPKLELSPEEQELFDLQQQHLARLDSISLPAFDSKAGGLDVLKMVAKTWGEMFSKRGIRLMLNDARLIELNTKYWASKEGLTEYKGMKQEGEEIMQAQAEVDLAQDNLRQAQEKLFEVVKRQGGSVV